MSAITKKFVGTGVETRSIIPRGGWLALASAFMGWMFDAMDLHLFTLIMVPAIRALSGLTDPVRIAQLGGLIVSVKLLCWGIGGVLFGVLADRLGRTRVMMLTIVIYSAFTGLSALAPSWLWLMVFQGLAGFGIGGEWAAGAALVVETWPASHRARAVQAMQAAFVFGLIAASLIALALADAGWRWIFAAGAIPAALTLAMRLVTPESKAWSEMKRLQSAQYAAPRPHPLALLFGPALRRRTIVASLMAFAMMAGSWGGTTLFPLLVRSVMGDAAGNAVATRAIGIAFLTMNVGALLGFAGIYLAVWRWPGISRRALFFVYCAGALVATPALFRYAHDAASLYALMICFGFFAVGGFGILALYITELYPLPVRATGQGFTWNVARIFTAAGPLITAVGLARMDLATVAVLFAWVFGVGLVAVLFGPEVGKTNADIEPSRAI